MKQRKHIILWGGVVAAAIITYFILGCITQVPSKCLHELGGDGIKNYYTYLQHSLHGKGWWFTGMNYPYGEHIMFVDGQPALSVTLASLRPYINLTVSNVTAILNLMMAFSFFLAIVFVYKLLLKYGVHFIWAFISACCIVFMSLQNKSMFGHYGLAYVSVIPMLFYWFACYYESSKIKYAVYLFVLTCIVMLLHPYNMAYILIWSTLYTIGYMIFMRLPIKRKLKHIIPVAASVILAFIIFKAISTSTDPIKDRPDYPHGLLSYTTMIPDVFTSADSPYWIKMHESENGKFLNPSYAYVGAGAVLTLCVFLFIWLYRYIRKSQSSAMRSLYGFPAIWLFIAFMGLLFSMGVPYVWNMEWLLDYIATLRQFRSLDRFALLYYHVAAVFAAILSYRLFVYYAIRKKFLLTLLAIIPLGSGLYEGYSMMMVLYKRGLNAPYNHDLVHGKLDEPWSEILKKYNYKASDFQAILHVPYYHVGSEKIWLFTGGWSLTLATKAAIQLNLPFVDANMSRSSWKQTFEQIKIAGGPYTEKNILDSIKDNRPFLMLVDLEFENPDDRYLMSVADSITQTKELKVFALYPEKLRKSDAAAMATFGQMAENMQVGDSSNTNSFFYYNHYDDAGNDIAFVGKQAMPAMDTNMMLTSIDVSKWPKDVQYEISSWFKVNERDHASPSLEMHLFDSTWQPITILSATVAQSSTDNYNMWFRAMNYFRIPENCYTLQMYLQTGNRIKYDSMDELLIRQVNDTILSKNSSGQVMINNHRLLPVRK